MILRVNSACLLLEVIRFCRIFQCRQKTSRINLWEEWQKTLFFQRHMTTLLIKLNSGIMFISYTPSKYFTKGWQQLRTPGLGIVMLRNVSCLHFIQPCHKMLPIQLHPYNYIGFQDVLFLQRIPSRILPLRIRVVFNLQLTLFTVSPYNLVFVAIAVRSIIFFFSFNLFDLSHYLLPLHLNPLYKH